MDRSPRCLKPLAGGKSSCVASSLKLSPKEAESKDPTGDTQSPELEYSTVKLQCWSRGSKRIHFSNKRGDSSIIVVKEEPLMVTFVALITRDVFQPLPRRGPNKRDAWLSFCSVIDWTQGDRHLSLSRPNINDFSACYDQKIPCLRLQ